MMAERPRRRRTQEQSQRSLHRVWQYIIAEEPYQGQAPMGWLRSPPPLARNLRTIHWSVIFAVVICCYSGTLLYAVFCVLIFQFAVNLLFPDILICCHTTLRQTSPEMSTSQQTQKISRLTILWKSGYNYINILCHLSSKPETRYHIHHLSDGRPEPRVPCRPG